MATFTATAGIDDHSFSGQSSDTVYFQFDAYANAGDAFDGGRGQDTIQIRSSMVAPDPDGGGMSATDEVYDLRGIDFRSFETLSFYPMARMDMPGRVTLTSDQFGGGRISDRLDLVGSDYSSTDVQVVTVRITRADAGFDASGWTFARYAIGDLPVEWTNGQDRIRLIGSRADDHIVGSSKSDLIAGGAGSDEADYSAETGDISVKLAGVRPTLLKIQGAANDTLKSIEAIEAGSGDDRLIGDGRANRFEGGAGADELRGAKGADDLRGDAGSDKLFGGRGVDRLDGGAGRDKLFGGVGPDRLDGGGGRDALFGGRGADRLDGGAGPDRLTGGRGADEFVFASGHGRDVVVDFTPKRSGGDVLSFNADLFDTVDAVLDAARQRGDDVIIQAEDTRDAVILKNFDLDDLSPSDVLIA